MNALNVGDRWTDDSGIERQVVEIRQFRRARFGELLTAAYDFNAQPQTPAEKEIEARIPHLKTAAQIDDEVAARLDADLADWPGWEVNGVVYPDWKSANRAQLEWNEIMKSAPPPRGGEVVPFPVAADRPRLQSASDLQQKEFAPIEWVVPGYVAAGLTIFAGRPKVGKSWLMLDVGLAVASGGSVLGVTAASGDVLYLGLEDNDRRMKARIEKVLGLFATTWPERFKFATAWPRAEQGGLDAIREWLGSVAAPRLVVVDVLAAFRSPASRSVSAYDADYAAVRGLQQIASETGIAIVLVHHLRKSASEGDPVDTISGTLGLAGAADAIMVLNRDGAGTTLVARGRDVEEIEKAVEFEKGRCRWKVLGEAGEVRVSDERKLVLTALRDATTALSPAEIAAATGMRSNNVRFLLSKMIRDGSVIQASYGRYLANTANTANSSTIPPINRSLSANTTHIPLPPLPPFPPQRQ